MMTPVPEDSDWFPVRITGVSGSAYTFQEVWSIPGGIIADKVGGRVNTANDYAYAIDGSTFAATAAGTAVQAFCRRSPGSGGTTWELKGFGQNPYYYAETGSVSGTAADGWVQTALPFSYAAILSGGGTFKVTATVPGLVVDAGAAFTLAWQFVRSDDGATWYETGWKHVAIVSGWPNYYGGPVSKWWGGSSTSSAYLLASVSPVYVGVRLKLWATGTTSFLSPIPNHIDGINPFPGQIRSERV